MDFPHLADIVESSPSKILMLVADGLGGLPHPETGKSELETARIPNLDRLAQRSACGLTVPVAAGVTPGSGPGHLGLFGYDPLKYIIGRGVLEAIGIGLDVRDGDVAARGNFCSVEAQGLITDRRAGRISTERCTELCQRLSAIKLAGVDVQVAPVREHRFVLMLRGPGLSPDVSETDPQKTGVAPLDTRAESAKGRKTAKLVTEWVTQARGMLADAAPANMVMLRGFSQLPRLPQMGEAYRLKPAAIAAYPMYRGLARLVGMEVIPTGMTFSEEMDTLAQRWRDHDFFYLHYKPADSAGEDGDFSRKVSMLEALDAAIPRLLEMKPDVFIVAGDHSTPAVLKGHSWHPVPFLLHSRWTGGLGVAGFNERACRQGALGEFPATRVMLQALAHAGKLMKYGA
ncbi:MAG: 2,3-bisphosphoglycerate-independent phosphoglycerate mutase [Dehalococcoidia bacterium]|nr:2,3-bisphosphoglycerate-independent phosphoglycerate mutase [Dehalococcoidia bacterium]